MKILSLTAGAASMYCGSCLRDNALAAELRRMGHEITLVPVYTPTKTDIANESQSSPVILFGGISVYLQQHSPLFRKLPGFLDGLLDSKWALGQAAKRSISVDPSGLGDMTVAMLEGDHGPIAREFRKLEHWLAGAERPDIVNLPNAMLIAMARSIRHVFSGPIVCTLQGEDLFLDHLPEPHRTHALRLIREQVAGVDGFVAISEGYARAMAEWLAIPAEKMYVVPVGVRVEDFAAASPMLGGEFRVGYLARVAPEKGLHWLAQAWSEFRRLHTGPARLIVAGYRAPEHASYLDEARRQVPAEEWQDLGEVGFAAKQQMLASLDAFCVPAAYDDPKALYLLEALASGVPVVAPNRGALAEHVSACGGGLLTEPDDPHALAAALAELAANPDRVGLGLSGRAGVARHRSLRLMAERTESVYRSLLAPAQSPVVA
jgi:glycosyltransferase involved in cell wall biosynthesis